MMKTKHLFILLAAVAIGFSAMAQKPAAQPDTRPGYLKTPTIPSFAMRKVPDSSVFSKRDLKSGKATVFMVFSPECSHCRDELKKLIANIDLFKDMQIVMYAPVRFDTTYGFYKAMELAKYPQFVMGSDPIFSLGGFYQISTLPTLFLYDKKGKFVRRYEGKDIIPERIATDY